MQKSKNCSNKKLRILIAEDHALVREGTRLVLEMEKDFEIVAEAKDGEEAIKFANKQQPQIELNQFSNREKEVLMLATKGLSNKETADHLSLSIRTVQAHFTRLLKKLQVNSRTEAVLYGLKEGWFSLDDDPDIH